MANHTNHKNNKPTSEDVRKEINIRVGNGQKKTQIARDLGISHAVVRKYSTPIQHLILDSVKEEALRLLDEGHAKSEIARSLGISRNYVSRLKPDLDRKPVRISNEIKEQLVGRVQAGETVTKVSRELGLDTGNASLIVKAGLRELSRDEIGQVKAMLLSNASQRSIVRELKLPLQLVSKVANDISGGSARRNVYTDNDRLKMAQLLSQGMPLHNIQLICGGTTATIKKAYKDMLKRGVIEPRIELAMEDDRLLLRIQRQFPHLEEWRVYAAEWYTVVDSNFGLVCSGINRFLTFIGKNNLFPRPADFLLRQNARLIPNFFEQECPKSDHGAASNNMVVDFLEWILIQPEFSDSDDESGPTTFPLFRSPLNRVNRSDHRVQRGSESNKQVMPYWMIDDLRRRITQGPNFSDWTWVQGLGGKITNSGDKESRTWFPVDETRLDKSDPDCVWRIRNRLGKGSVIEMWSPVRWVACLLKLQTTGRMGQIRMLDSGEADTFVVRNGELVENDSLIKSGTHKKPRRQGAIRLASEGNVVIYFNTNKTADIGKVGARKGQECPWPKFDKIEEDPYYWIEKLRAWQAKYNPPSNLISWKDIPSSRRLKGKSDAVCSTYPDAVFLFRTAEIEGSSQYPVAAGAVDKSWQTIMAEYENVLDSEGKRNPDGTAIQLIRDGRSEITIHGLRVSLITHLILDGDMPPALMMKIVGHARFVMTIYYTKPGLKRIEDALFDATARIDAAKDETLLRDLQSWSAEQIRDRVVFNAKELIDIIPLNPVDRNPLGWLPMHDGVCLAGGNSGPLNGDPQFPGCHNGALEIVVGQSHRGPAPGGVRNCSRCRWKCAGKNNLLGLQATFNNRQFHLHKASAAAIDAERSRNAILQEKAIVEAGGGPFTKLRDLSTAERLYEASMQKLQELALDLAAIHRMIERVVALPDEVEGRYVLAAQGDLRTVHSIVEETDSDLLILSEICAGVELYPDLDPGTAIFEYAQLLDIAFEREGKPPILSRLSEKEKLSMANAIMRELERHVNPENPILARRKIINTIDRGESLRVALGIDLTTLLDSVDVNDSLEPIRLYAKN